MSYEKKPFGFDQGCFGLFILVHIIHSYINCKHNKRQKDWYKNVHIFTRLLKADIHY